MSRLATLRCAVLLSLLLTAGALVVPTSASAVPLAGTATVSATATGPTSGVGADASITVKITVADAPIGAATLTAPVPGTVDPTAITVDNAKPLAGTASGTAGDGRTDVTVHLGAGATPLAVGVLTVGTHTVTIPTDLAPRAGTTIAPVVTTLKYLDAGSGNTASTTATATIPLPDLVVTRPAGTGEGMVLPLAKDDEAFFVARIASRSPVSAANVTVTVPRGLQVDSELGIIRAPAEGEPESLRCVTGQDGRLTCPLGRVDEPQFVVVPVIATGTGTIGSTGTLTVAAFAANGLDATPADNVVRGTVRFVPPIQLRVDLTADHTTVEVGAKAHVTAAVTNAGSYPAPDVLGVIVAANSKPSNKAKKHFRVTGFTGDTADLGDVGSGSGVVITGATPRAMRQATTLLAQRVAARRQASKSGDDVDLLAWNVGTLAPHATRSAVLTLKALAPGKGVVVAAATSLQSLDSCFLEGDPFRCPEVDRVTLRAVASAGTDGAGDDPIANTGVPTERWAGFALLLLVIGAAAQFAGVRRPSIFGRHRS